ncbi:hypothetical protein HGI30_16655 [Paenibacillus albicereus]|uniref:WYL domain-containing protein n=1 Tax=Paenibacillus albicereus TaxID=2726185 RepID=A0A6H2H065_9BACL|nr:hypothetical protein [Paenibacillus albicereus]QJC53042.1 hypothetical protein HGI30_16655 [Paenibacillus albicereus]
MSIDRYIGRGVTVIYQDAAGDISKRDLTIQSVADGRLHGFDRAARAPRTLLLERILAWESADAKRVRPRA